MQAIEHFPLLKKQLQTAHNSPIRGSVSPPIQSCAYCQRSALLIPTEHRKLLGCKQSSCYICSHNYMYSTVVLRFKGCLLCFQKIPCSHNRMMSRTTHISPLLCLPSTQKYNYLQILLRYLMLRCYLTHQLIPMLAILHWIQFKY